MAGKQCPETLWNVHATAWAWQWSGAGNTGG